MTDTEADLVATMIEVLILQAAGVAECRRGDIEAARGFATRHAEACDRGVALVRAIKRDGDVDAN